MRKRFYLQSANYGRGIEMRLCTIDEGGAVTGEAAPPEFKKVEDGATWAEPFTTLSMDAAQNLMDELWFLGFRPERGEMSVGQVAATEKHLQDMRSIVFEKLKVKKP